MEHYRKMLLARASREFLQGYFSTHIRQPKTRSAYYSDMAQFEQFAGSDTNIRVLNNTLIEEWVAHLKSKAYSPASIRRKVVVLKLFFSYWVRKGVLNESPFWRVQIHFGRIVQLPRALTEIEMTTLLKQGHSDYRNREKDQTGGAQKPLGNGQSVSRNFRVVRNLAILELFFATGMRVGEVSAMNIVDFSIVEGSIKVRGKGGKERLAFVVDKFALRILREYLKLRHANNTASGSLFLNASGNRLSPQGIANIIRLIRSNSGMDKHVTPHMLRHTVATMLLRNGVDIRVVQEFLGHASITTTQRYTHITKEHMLRELRNRHPSLTFQR